MAYEWTEADAKIFHDVQEHGWHVMIVADRPAFAYTIGLFARFQKPELIVFGLHPTDLHQVCNLYGAAMRDGLAAPEDMVEGRRTEFRAITPSDRFGRAHWFYRNRPFPALQLFWSDPKGKFPWDKDCHPAVREAQPTA